MKNMHRKERRDIKIGIIEGKKDCETKEGANFEQLAE